MQTHLQKQQLLGRRDGKQLKPVAFSIDGKIEKVMLCSYLREKYQAEVEDIASHAHSSRFSSRADKNAFL